MLTEKKKSEKEMEEIKRDEIRTKGVGRLVDKLIAEAMRDGKFHVVQGKGKSSVFRLFF